MLCCAHFSNSRFWESRCCSQLPRDSAKGIRLKLLLVQVNDTITFRLLQRSRDSIIPKEVPLPPHAPTEGDDPDPSGPSTTWGPARLPIDTTAAAAAATATVPGQGSTSHLKGEKKPAAKGDTAAESKGNRKGRGKGHKQSSVVDEGDTGRGFNTYAKFTTVGDGKAFWKAAAEELARYAAQVCTILAFAVLWTVCSACLLCCVVAGSPAVLSML